MPHSPCSPGHGVNVWSVGATGQVQQLEGVGVKSRGGLGRYRPGAPSDHPHSPRPARRGVHMWSVGAAGPVQQPEQTRWRRLCPIRPPFFALFYSVIYNSVDYSLAIENVSSVFCFMKNFYDSELIFVYSNCKEFVKH